MKRRYTFDDAMKSVKSTPRKITKEDERLIFELLKEGGFFNKIPDLPPLEIDEDPR